jgi:dTDP-4-dehydrorhamnose reductase
MLYQEESDISMSGVTIITGAGGYIADHLLRLIQGNTLVLSTSREVGSRENCIPLDLEHPKAFDYGRVSSGDYVVHLAAVTSPDICSNQPEYAWQVNVSGACVFIENCLKRNARVLFFSSDTVYGIDNRCFDEDSPSSPFGAYGIMKHRVESEFIGEENLKIFRLSYVFSKMDKFTRYLTKCAQEACEAEIFHPFYRNVTYLKDVLDAITGLYAKWELFTNKVFNICGDDLLSRADLCSYYRQLIFPELRFKIIEPLDSFFEARPRSIRVKSKYLRDLLRRPPFSIKNAMVLEFDK